MRLAISCATRRVRPWRAAAGALLVFGALIGCAKDAPAPVTASAPPPSAPAEPEWRVGALWTNVVDDLLLFASRDVIAECVIDRLPGFDGATYVAAPRGFEVRNAAGERKLWGAVSTPPAEPTSRELSMNWVDDVDPRAQTPVLGGVVRKLNGEPPC